MAENKVGPQSGRVQRQTGPLSPVAEVGVAAFETHLRDVEDLSAGALRAYLADVRLFAVWCETQWLAQIMGHDSLKTTARYTQATARALQAEVEQIAWR